jgi:hypothetical protein
MKTEQMRQPSGIPVGGEFASHRRPDGNVALGDQGRDPEDHWFEDENEVPEHVEQDTFTFNTSRLAAAIAKIDKANKRLARAHVNAHFEYTLDTKVVFDERHLMHIERTTLTLNRPVLKQEGWTFEAAFDFTPDGDVVRAYAVDGDVTDPVNSHCDVCNTNRQRERVYSLRNTEGMKTQVGSTCLASFLGIRPEGLWALDYDLDFEEGEDDDETDWSTRSGYAVYPAENLIAAALEASDNGKEFISRSRSTFDHPATADLVTSDFNKYNDVVTDKQLAEARRIIRWVKSLPDDDNNDYTANLRALLVPKKRGDEKWVKSKHVPTAASAVGSYYAAKDKATAGKIRKEQKAAEVKGYLAEPKAKLEAVRATVVTSRYLGDQQYPSTIVKLLTEDGHAVSWFAAGSKDFTPGQKVNIRATVKANEIYQDSYETVITRAKLTDPETGEVQG